MKRIHLILRAVALALVIAFFCLYQKEALARAALVAENEEQIAAAEAWNAEIERKMAEDAGVEAEQLGYYTDGIYDGCGTGFGGDIRVTVTIEKGYITAVDVVSHDKEDPAYYGMAEGLIPEIVKHQYAQVDTVTGATLSSNGIISAVEDALKQAEPAA